jgi:hypothetical protein
VTDLFAAAKPPPEPELDTKVRWRRIPDSEGHYLFHPCSVCGSVEAHFGEGFSERKRTGGKWWCAAHWAEHVAKRGTGK